MLRVEIKKNTLSGAPERLRRKFYGVTRRAAKAIAEATQENIARHGLIDTGYMYGSVTPQAAPEGIYNVAEVRVKAPYAIFHELGTRHVPARPFLGPAVEAYRQSYTDQIAEAVREVMAEEGAISLDFDIEASYFGGDR